MTAAAYLANGQPLARDAFYALACDPQRSVVVEACAGAGKTWMLVSRILRALLDGAQPHEILAITFTRKAAGEMRARLNEWLREFAAPHCSDAAREMALIERGMSAAEARRLAPQLATLHERVLCAGRPVEIRTFHAWFSQLLRAAPLELLNELGLQQDMDLIEDLDDHRGEVFRRFHTAVLADAALRADYAALVAQRGRSQARKWLEAVWNKRVEFELADAAGALEGSVPPPALERDGEHPAQSLLGAAWQASLRELALALRLGGMRAQDAATGLVLALEQADAQARFESVWAALFTKDDTPRRQLGQVAALAPVQDELAAIAAQIHQLESHFEHLRMVRLARVLLAEFAAYKRARGLADMSDLERCGLALLRDATLAGWVQERLDARIRHVLIDEFQDTSPLQWHALHAWLAAYAGAGGGASGQRPPGLFIVGDPKQSIYRFRRAEPRVFEAAQRFVVDALGGTLLACDHTRRNAPELLAPLNAVFEQAQQAGEFSGFRAHTTELGDAFQAGLFALSRVPRPLRVERSVPDAPAAWRDSLTTPRHEPEEVLREQEAARVAQAILALVANEAVAPGDIFVLSRKRQSLRLVAQALRDVHVPYAAAEDAALMDAPEARDLVALLDVLVSPRHRLSLAQALRSPLFGASDDDLIALAARARHAHGGDWWRALVQGADDASAALRRAGELLPRWRAASMALPPHDLLDRIVFEGELRERVAATVPPVQRAAALDTIDAVLAQALTLDGARYATPYNFVRALKRRSVRAAATAHADAVQLLTVHGAKGLEAKVVFVMDADPEPTNPETATLLIDWPVESEHPRCCAFIYSEAACPPSLLPVLDAERAARRREELNGLYVAMSRAKQRLVFSATEPSRRAPGASWWDRIAPRAVALAPAAATAPPASSTPPPVRLKTLAPLTRSGPIAPAPAATRDPRDSDDSDATRLGQAVHRVLEWAAAATAPDASWADLAQAAAAEFGAPTAAVAQLARTIRNSPDCTRFFGGPELRWAGNEVPISDAGELLRIDRLVQLDVPGGPVWWVLDYKLQHAPQQLEAYRAQLLRYRDAVRRAQPGDDVRCAFITGAGGVVEIP